MMMTWGRLAAMKLMRVVLSYILFDGKANTANIMEWGIRAKRRGASTVAQIYTYNL